MSRMADNNLAFISLDKGICNKCKHVFRDGEKCKAFPQGIPDEILTGEFDHHNAYEGDNGIRFSRR